MGALIHVPPLIEADLMWSFLTDLARNPSLTHTVVVMDSDEVGQTRRYQVQPRRMLLAWGGSLFLVALIVASLMAFTPLRQWLPGAETEEMRQHAELNAVRVNALQDSMEVQRQYIERLQQLITGQIDSVARRSGGLSRDIQASAEQTNRSQPAERGSDGSESHVQPALTPSSIPVSGPMRREGEVRSSLTLPVDPPVASGFPTREFDARERHYGVDIAVSEGASVRAIKDGYVVLADWTQDGGYTIAVQHPDGYLSVYKHNKRLLKQMGDRVKAQEALAVSGNTGEITTGPHLHFELWRNGLAQDPRPYITGW